MKTRRSFHFWAAVAGLLLIAIAAIWLALPGVMPTHAASGMPNALTPGQTAAIQSANQLLLFGDSSSSIYLPIIAR
jgi:hypothetical protein